MDTNTITALVSSVGFPIVACIGVAWYVVKMQAQNNQAIQTMQDNTNKAIDKMADALNNNTIIITKLAERLDSQNKEVKPQ